MSSGPDSGVSKGATRTVASVLLGLKAEWTLSEVHEGVDRSTFRAVIGPDVDSVPSTTLGFGLRRPTVPLELRLGWTVNSRRQHARVLGHDLGQPPSVTVQGPRRRAGPSGQELGGDGRWRTCRRGRHAAGDPTVIAPPTQPPSHGPISFTPRGSLVDPSGVTPCELGFQSSTFILSDPMGIDEAPGYRAGGGR
jgi:hypothetical protein